MATRSQIERAFMNAHEAGDTKTAKLLAQAIRAGQFEDRPRPQPVSADAGLPGQPPRPQPVAEPTSRALANPALKEDAQDVGLLEGMGRTAMAGYNRAFAGISRAAGDVVEQFDELGQVVGLAGGNGQLESRALAPPQDNEIAQALRGGATALDERAEDYSVRNPEAGTFDSPTAFALTAGEALTQMAPALALGPAGGAAFVGADVYGQELKAGEEMGLGQNEVRTRAASLAAIELLTERIPLQAILTPGGKGMTGGARKILEGAGLESVQEGLVSAAQMTLDRYGFDQEDAFKDGWRQIAESMAVGGAIGGTLATPAAGDGILADRRQPPPPRREPTVQPEETPDPSDDVAAGVESVNPELVEAFNDPEAQYTPPSADGNLPPWADQLNQLGIDTSNLEEPTDESDQQGPLRAAGQQPDGAQPDRGLNDLPDGRGEFADSLALQDRGQADNLDQRGLADGQPDVSGLQEPGRGGGRLSEALSDGRPAGSVSPAQIAGVGVDVDVEGQPSTLALNRIPGERPELSPEDETALGQELGILDERGDDIDETDRARALALSEADEAVEEPALDFKPPPNVEEPRLQEPYFRDQMQAEIADLDEEISRSKETGRDLLNDIAANGGINAESFEELTAGRNDKSEETRWWNKDPAIKSRTQGKPIFRRGNGGVKLDELPTLLTELGYLKPGAGMADSEFSENDMLDMLERAFSGEKMGFQAGSGRVRQWGGGFTPPKELRQALSNAAEGRRMGPNQQEILSQFLDHYEGPVDARGALIPELEELYEAEGAELWEGSGYDPAQAPVLTPEFEPILTDSKADIVEWLDYIRIAGRTPESEETTDEQEASDEIGEWLDYIESATDTGRDPGSDGAEADATSGAQEAAEPVVDDAEGRPGREPAADNAEDSSDSSESTEARTVAEPATDLAGPVNPQAQAIADETARQDARRNNDTGAPIDVDGGLFSAEAGSPDLFSAATIDAKASRADPDPTEAQIEADNYRKGEPIYWKGQTLVIETPKGVARKGWDILMPAHYGDVKGTTGKDGDALDVFIGPDLDSAPKAYVKNQMAADGSFDEHKILLGFKTRKAATAAYSGSYDVAPTGSVVTVPVDDLLGWIDTGDHQAPYPVDTAELRAIRQLRKRIAVHEKIRDCVSA